MNPYATTREQIEADLGHALPLSAGTFIANADGSLTPHEQPAAEGMVQIAPEIQPDPAMAVTMAELEARAATEGPDEKAAVTQSKAKAKEA